MNDNLALLNRAQYLYLRRISEPSDNPLGIVVQEATANQIPCDDQFGMLELG